MSRALRLGWWLGRERKCSSVWMIRSSFGGDGPLALAGVLALATDSAEERAAVVRDEVGDDGTTDGFPVSAAKS